MEKLKLLLQPISSTVIQPLKQGKYYIRKNICATQEVAQPDLLNKRTCNSYLYSHKEQPKGKRNDLRLNMSWSYDHY